ncbi:hypothetical protein [Rugosimonospora acidiphila]
MEVSRRRLLSGAAGMAAAGLGSSVLLGEADPAAAAPATPAAGSPPLAHLPATALRGYGTLAADSLRIGDLSVLRIQCASTDSAKLVHAKYLSDLTRLPGVTRTTLSLGPLTLPLYQTAAGVVAALTSDKTVVILAANGKPEFTTHAATAIPKGARTADFGPQVDVPLYLDRFDKYGLLFYFAPFALPLTWDHTKVYDYGQDFDFIEQNGLGVALWDQPLEINSAEGLTRVPDWDWVAAEFARRGIPAHINTQIADGMWLPNRYREQTMQKMPQYTGYYGNPGASNYGVGPISYAATTAMDAELGQLQDTVRQYAGSDNVVGWLEPHGELSGAPASVALVEYGPVADASFRTFLTNRYKELSALATAWHGSAGAIASWDDVHVPEVASFVGWGPEAVDLTGTWRVLYPGAVAPPSGWDQPGFDDTSWGSLVMPGSDRVEFLPRQAMLARGTVAVSADWLAAHPRVWLYSFDLNSGFAAPMPVSINGHPTAGIPVQLLQHFGSVEVTGLLQAGDNLVTLTLPQGYLGYRAFLTGDEPKQYPSLGPQKNAQWVDFQDWSRWIRQGAIRRGVEMIRQVDAQRPVNLMSPDSYADLLKQVAAEYGANFHNTGYAAGYWAEFHPLLMRSVGRPSTAEPGAGPQNADQLRYCFGRWISEGLNGITYFPSQEDAMSRPDVLALFLANRTMYESIGKYHVPTAQVAVLYDMRLPGHGAFPWQPDPNVWLPGGYYATNSGYALLPVCPRDGVSYLDFADGTVDKYQVIIDANSPFMDEQLVDQIEAWVRKGGTFITYMQTGRHTPTEVDAWPINRLTGYEVTGKDTYTAHQPALGQQSYSADASHPLTPAAGQPVFTDTTWLAGVRGSGLRLRKVAADAQNLLLWEDGTVAAGMRKLGNGRIIHLGCHFEEIMDRNPAPDTTRFLGQVMDYLKVERVPASAADVVFRHFISNTGLHDVWVLYNDTANPVTTNLKFTGPHPPTELSELNSSTITPVTTTNGQPGVYGIILPAWETRMFISPRSDVVGSPLEWLTLQRDWWSGTAKPDPTPLPTRAELQRNVVAFRDDWAFLPVDGAAAADIAALTASDVDDSGWERRSLGIWTHPDHPEVRHAVLRRTFTIPADWTSGDIELWLAMDRENTTFHDTGRIYLDGKLIRDFNAGGLSGLPATALLPPGDHVMALEIQGASVATGVTAEAWAYHIPEPTARQDLSGSWTVTSANGLQETGEVSLPGSFTGSFAARDVTIDASHAGSNVVLYVQRPGASLSGILINGTVIGDLYPALRAGDNLLVNITNKVKFGGTNQIELFSSNSAAAAKINGVEIRFYDPAVYP